MSKKQSLTRAIALGLLLSTPFYEIAMAAPAVDSDSITENIVIDDSAATKTYTTGDGSSDTDRVGERGGNAGNITINATLESNVTADISITATAGKGGNNVQADGNNGGPGSTTGGNPDQPDGGKGGHGGDTTVGIATKSGTLDIQAKDITIVATAGESGHGGTSYMTGGSGGDGADGGAAIAYGLKMLSTNGKVSVQNITITATAGSGGGGGGLSGSAIDSGGDIGEEGAVGIARADGMLLTDSSQLTISSEDITVTAKAGQGAVVTAGATAQATGWNLDNNNHLDITTGNLTIEAYTGADSNWYSSSGNEVAQAIGVYLADSSNIAMTAGELAITAKAGSVRDIGPSDAIAQGLSLAAASSRITTDAITVKATGSASGERTNAADGVTILTADKGGLATADAVHITNSTDLEVVTADIAVTTTGGKGGSGRISGGTNGVNGGVGGDSVATGLHLANSNSLTIKAQDLNIIAIGGEGGGSSSAYNGLPFTMGGLGGAAQAYGLDILSANAVVTAQAIVVQATGGVGGSGAGGRFVGVPHDGHIGSVGGLATGYGIHTAGAAKATLAADSIAVTATGGVGGRGGTGAFSGASGKGGDGGDAVAYGAHASAASYLDITTDSINVTADGGNGGGGGGGGTSGAGTLGDGGDGGDAIAYGAHASAASHLNITTDSISVTAGGGEGGKGDGGIYGNPGNLPLGATGNIGNATAYGVYAESGASVTLGSSSGTFQIGITASGTETATYAVYADQASVLFNSAAEINKDAALTGDNNSAIAYLNNSTFGFAGDTAGRTLTGGTLQLSGSNTFIVNTDLTNNAPTADKLVFDSLAAGSSSATQYIKVGYDPSVKLDKDQTIDLSAAPVEIFKITDMNGQTLDNFVAQKNVLDGTLYKYDITPEISIGSDNIEITSVTTAKTMMPSESVMTASDAMMGISNMWRIEGNNLMKRMGDLRSDSEAAKGGVWARYYRGDLSAASSYGRSLSQDYTAFQGGIDRVQAYKDGRIYTGLAVSHIDGHSSYNMGSGDAGSTGMGLYASWIGNKGHYADVILRASRLNTSYKLVDSNSNHINADYSTWAYGISAEYGYRHKMQAG